MHIAPYAPPRFLRNGHVNSMLASSPLRKRLVHKQCATLLSCSMQRILHLQDDVRLLAKFNVSDSKQPANHEAIVLLHGWEGCSESLYLLDIAQQLHSSGYDVIRINFRDHGNTHHLNKELFHSCRLEEMCNAVSAVQHSMGNRPLILIGFSLGGNFALRIAANSDITLSQVIAICPVVSPVNTMLRLESSPAFYHHYFLKRWKQSLRQKSRAFPNLYHYQEIKNIRSLREMTRKLVLRFTQFNSLEEYLNGYSIAGNRLENITTPTFTLFSEDDPLIPASDSTLLAKNPAIQQYHSRYGGHCGFLDEGLRLNWLSKFIKSAINSIQ